MAKIFYIVVALFFLSLGYDLQAAFGEIGQPLKVLYARNKNPIVKKRKRASFSRPSQDPIPLVDERKSLTLSSGKKAFFSTLLDILHFIRAYEKGYIKGLHVCFDRTGIYYDQKYGENWWEYYFEPVVLGEVAAPIAFCQCNSAPNEFPIQQEGTQIENHSIIKKYIHIKPTIQSKLDAFIAKNWQKQFVIGVEYYNEGSISSSYEKIMSEVESKVQAIEKEKKSYRIFLVTNEPKLLNTLQKKFSEKLTILDSASIERDPYSDGEEAILQCLLLAKCDLFIAADSILSACVYCFNPSLAH